jgi:hypothetical protein
MSVMFNVTLESAGAEPSNNQIDDWMDALAPFHGVVAGSDRPDRLEYILSLPAETMVQALAAAVAVVERSTSRPVISAEVMPTDEFDVRNGMTPTPELMSVTEVAKHWGITRQAVLKMIHARKFANVTRVGDSWALNRAEVYARQEALGFTSRGSTFD